MFGRETRDLRPQGGALIRNAEFLRFAHHWDFTPPACRALSCRTKGKVGRPGRRAGRAMIPTVTRAI